MRDQAIVDLIRMGRLRVDAEQGLVFAPKSNTPTSPVGALTRKGYLRVCINLDGRQQHFMVHRVVWVSQNGCMSDDMQVNHRNGRKTDNRIANLEPLTCLGNMSHAAAHDLTRPVTGERHHSARLTLEQALAIQLRVNGGESAVALAAEYGVSAGHVRRIARSERWRREFLAAVLDEFPVGGAA